MLWLSYAKYLRIRVPFMSSTDPLSSAAVDVVSLCEIMVSAQSGTKRGTVNYLRLTCEQNSLICDFVVTAPQLHLFLAGEKVQFDGGREKGTTVAATTGTGNDCEPFENNRITRALLNRPHETLRETILCRLPVRAERRKGGTRLQQFNSIHLGHG